LAAESFFLYVLFIFYKSLVLLVMWYELLFGCRVFTARSYA